MHRISRRKQADDPRRLNDRLPTTYYTYILLIERHDMPTTSAITTGASGFAVVTVDTGAAVADLCVSV